MCWEFRGLQRRLVAHKKGAKEGQERSSEGSYKSVIMTATPTARAPAAFRTPVGWTIPKLEAEEGVSVEDTIAFFVTEAEAAVGMNSIAEIVEMNSIAEIVERAMDANVVELLVRSEVVWFRSAPPTAVEVDVIVGVIVRISRFDGGELVGFDIGFDGLVGWYVLRELAAVPRLTFLSLALPAISPVPEENPCIWHRELVCADMGQERLLGSQV